MSRFSSGYDDEGDGFRSPGDVVKDGNTSIAEEKVALLSYQDQLDALAASVGITKYVLLLADRLAKGDNVSRPYGDDRVVVKGEYSEIVTSQQSIDAATAVLPALIGLIWPKA
jgi:hypothetical protein